MKINFDAAIDKKGKKMGVWVVIRDHAGNVKVVKGMMRPFIYDPTVAEATAVWVAGLQRTWLDKWG